MRHELQFARTFRADSAPQPARDGTTVVYAATIFLVMLGFLMSRSSHMLLDGDTYWHLIVGGDILHNRSLPTVDGYSYTRAGAPWIAKEWLSQIAFYGAYSLAGWFGVCLMTATVAASAYAFLFAWLCRRVAPIVALTMTTVTVSLGSASLLARPQIFFYLLLTVCACGLVGAVEKKKTPWWLPFLAALWANLHASFPIALILAALFGFEAVVSAAPAERARTAAKWGLVLLASLAAAGATPYGYDPLLVSLKIVGSKEIDAIDEWRPIGLDSMSLYGAAFIAVSLAIAAASRAGWTRAAPLLFCAALMARHVRFFPLFAIVAAASLATPVARKFPRFARRPSAARPATRKTSAAALGLACLAAASVLVFAPKPVPDAKMTPAAALEAAREWPVAGPAFNDYPFGAFLIFNRIKTFIDSRAELYAGGLLQKTRSAELAQSDAAFLSLLDEYRVTWAFLVNDSPGADKLRRSKDWREIFKDDVSTVFVRN
jgi:hypothetical protein